MIRALRPPTFLLGRFNEGIIFSKWEAKKRKQRRCATARFMIAGHAEAILLFGVGFSCQSKSDLGAAGGTKIWE